MTTTIVFNGSKWNGEEQDTVEDLLRVLGEETLAPSFDGDFVRRVEFNVAKHHGVDPARAFHISGNFFTRSHAFSIFTDDDEVYAALHAAIKKNVDGDAYRAARAEYRADVAKKKAAESAFIARHNSRR